MRHILLIEDDVWFSELYGSALERDDAFKVIYAKSAVEALKILDNQSVDLIILDIFLGFNNGIELLHELASYTDTRGLSVFILTSVSEYDFDMSKQRWSDYGVVKYLYKPATKPADLVKETQARFSIKDNR